MISNFVGILIFVGVPAIFFALFLAVMVRIYKFAKGFGNKLGTAKPVSNTMRTSVAAKSASGATELPTRTVAGQWFCSPDVSHLEKPAFLRKQVA
ncbi:hypothetical protein [Marinobacter sp. F3R08]|uniref:hypothetical protein n=1 Tax=Marinobacter sp. F3R08 TaxID=2841559 RepID=UPI001C09F533|nr:hypothetical protein [Marinobacter sp. F3R08]MBU2952265.1 hypothetical protein [Marinobacter sp. F3R08]